jgi:hypothetical protein
VSRPAPETELTLPVAISVSPACQFATADSNEPMLSPSLLMSSNLKPTLWYRVVSVIPLERISEFVDEPLNGPIAVERL